MTSTSSGISGDAWKAGPTYSYDDLLSRVHTLIEERNPSLGTSKGVSIKLRPPQVDRLGSKKVIFVNFAEMCETIHRSEDHVFQFFLAELGTTGSITGDHQLVLKGRYTSRHVESLLRKYISEYVLCEMCRSTNTEFNRDPATRLYEFSCQNCGATKTVHSIRTGFHATTKADRKAMKAAAKI
jgi:translation initiation factor 2 subunit 2